MGMMMRRHRDRHDAETSETMEARKGPFLHPEESAVAPEPMADESEINEE